MSLQTVPARWFEVLTLPELIPAAVENLARTGSVELETATTGGGTLALPDLRSRMEAFHQLAERYRPYWPEPTSRGTEEQPSMVTALDNALAILQTWAREADPHVRALEVARRQQRDLALLQGFLASLGPDSGLDLGDLSGTGPSLASTLFVLPAEAELPALARRVLVERIQTGDQLFLLTLGPPATLEELREELSGERVRPLPLPPWLRGRPGRALAQVTDRLADLEQEETTERQALADLNQRHGVAGALGTIQRLDWLVANMPRVPVSEHFAWITGWTDDWEGSTLPPALAGIPALIHFPGPPPGREPPQLLRNPAWLRPFELFARLIGIPQRNEADPTWALALIAPLLFGYMFGDVGQGLVLIAVGWALRHRIPPLRLLIPGGLAAVVFGLLFGSVFSLEHVLPPLWLHPLEAPLPVLLIPLVGGAVLILLSMLLGGLQSLWLGRGGRWLIADAGLLVLYLGAVLSPWSAAGKYLVLAGLAWFLGGAAWEARGQGWLALPTAVGQLAERGMRLLVNTLSFARVGAFTLAHAGLSQAVTSLAAAMGTAIAGGVIIVLGNLVIIVLEGLVVSVQTTRLILFEFFVRFLHGGGRPFRPISPPTARALVEDQGGSNVP
jgi:V/A-type H+-transporting ATPase subunit I